MEKLFRLMVFNILAHNKDDHSKNFSFRYINNKWELSPAYDLTYNLGINGQHMTDVMGNGNPDLKNVLSIAENFNIKNVGKIVNEINMKVQNFPDYAKKYNLINSDINKSLEDIQPIFFKDRLNNNKKNNSKK